MDVAVKDLRNELKAVLDAVEHGQSYTVTRRGKPLARIVPVEQPGAYTAEGDTLPWFGMWADREDMVDPSAWVREQRKPRYTVFGDGPPYAPDDERADDAD